MGAMIKERMRARENERRTCIFAGVHNRVTRSTIGGDGLENACMHDSAEAPRRREQCDGVRLGGIPRRRILTQTSRIEVLLCAVVYLACWRNVDGVRVKSAERRSRPGHEEIVQMEKARLAKPSLSPGVVLSGKHGQYRSIFVPVQRFTPIKLAVRSLKLVFVMVNKFWAEIVSEWREANERGRTRLNFATLYSLHTHTFTHMISSQLALHQG